MSVSIIPPLSHSMKSADPDCIRVLVVEDDLDTRENLRDILELDGHEVTLTGSVAEVLRIEDLSGFSAIILDWRLPDGNGDALLPRLRERAPETPVIVSTGTIGLNGALLALRHGAADYIIKPISPDSLRASIGRIVEKRRVDRALQATQQRIRFQAHLLNVVEQAIVATDLRGRITYWNRHASTLTGFPENQATGRLLTELLLPAESRSEGDEIQERIVEGASWSGELVLTRLDGSHFPAQVSQTPVFEESGDLQSAVFVAVDLTERKLAQERMLQSERLVAIGEAMAGLAHESRNALQRSQANLEMLTRRVSDRPEALELIARIQRAQDDLHQLYEEVREYSAPIRLRLETSSLEDLLKEAWDDLGVVRKNRNAMLLGECGPVRSGCAVDRFAVRQVLRNLLENSLAAASDPVEIRYSCEEAVLNRQPAVCLRVLDNGPGLTPEQRTRIFDPFFTTKTHGTGLGMAIARRIVEAHGGTITIGNRSPGAEIVLHFPKART